MSQSVPDELDRVVEGDFESVEEDDDEVNFELDTEILATEVWTAEVLREHHNQWDFYAFGDISVAHLNQLNLRCFLEFSFRVFHCLHSDQL